MKRRTDERLTLAVKLLGQDRLTDAEIAEQVGIGRRTLARWKKLPGVPEQIAQGKELAKQRFRRDVRRIANGMRRAGRVR